MPQQQPLQKTAQSMAAWMLIRQVLVLFVVTLALYMWQPGLALSVLLGGTISFVSQAWFSIRAFRYRADEQPEKALMSLYSGETGKIIITALLFALVFRFSAAGTIALNPLWLFLGFIVVQSVVWLAPFMLRNK